MADLKDFSEYLNETNPGWREAYQAWRQGKAKGAKGEAFDMENPKVAFFGKHSVSAQSDPVLHAGMFSVKVNSVAMGTISEFAEDRADFAEVEPLFENSDSKMTTAATTASLITAMIGSTMLAMPALVRKGGLIAAPVILVTAAYIVNDMGKLICETIDEVASRGKVVARFADMLQYCIGDGASKVATITSTCALTGFVIVPIIIMADSLETLVPSVTYKMFMVLLLPINIIVANIRDMRTLGKFGQLGVAACGACVLLFFASALKALDMNRQWPPEYRKFGVVRDVEANIPQFYSLAPAQISTLGSVFAVAFFNFAVLVSIPTIRSQMQNPEDMPQCLNKSFGIATIFNLLAMLIGYWGFGNYVHDNAMLSVGTNYPDRHWEQVKPWEVGDTSALAKFLAIAIILNLIVSYPIYQICLALAFESKLEVFKRSWTASTALRTAIATGIVAIALLVPFFLQILAIVSSLFCVMNNVLFPLGCYYSLKREMHQNVVGLRMCAHVVCAILALMVMLIGVTDSTMDLLKKVKEQPQLANPTLGWWPTTTSIPIISE